MSYFVGFIYILFLYVVHVFGLCFGLLIHNIKEFIYLMLMMFIYAVMVFVLIYKLPMMFPSILKSVPNVLSSIKHYYLFRFGAFKNIKFREYIRENLKKNSNGKKHVFIKNKLLPYLNQSLIQSLDDHLTDELSVSSKSHRHAAKSINEIKKGFRDFLLIFKKAKRDIREALKLLS